MPRAYRSGVAVEEMECLLDFMYRGSIDVAEEHLPSLIKTATDLEIRGLSGEQKNQENNRNPYARVEARMQRCHIETRVHTTEYIKDPSVIPFLPKHSDLEEMEDSIKVEDIEVEDDPMVIDGHEDSFDELPQSTEAQIVSALCQLTRHGSVPTSLRKVSRRLRLEVTRHTHTRALVEYLDSTSVWK